MEVDNCLENQLHSWVSTKTKAPSPPGLKDLDSPGFSHWYPGNPHLPMEQNEKTIDKDLSLVVVLPGGVEKMTTVHGSKPLMDLLVTLCAKYHLNPSGHTLELVTANRNNIKLKPNALIGTLDAERVLIKPKGEDKSKKSTSQMPEATVRMVINYKKTQKTILRVNPRIPLAELLPAICEKCEFDIGSTVLLRDIHSLAPLDLSSSLNDYAIREIYARNTNAPRSSPVCPSSPIHSGTVIPGKDKNQKEKENKGLFSMFRKSKKNTERAKTASAPSSPVLVSKPRPLSMALPSTHSPSLGSPTSPVDTPKKRRAPPPPLLSSQSLDISARRRFNSEPNNRLDGDQAAGLNRGSFTDSSLRRTKRKAPPPPTSPSPVQDSVFLDENAGGAAANTLEEITEQDEATHPAMSPSANGGQGDDFSISTSAETVTASLHSPSPDTDILSTASAEDDLSSELNQMASSMNDSETARTPSPDTEERNAASCQVNSLSEQPISEEPAREAVELDHAAEAHSPDQNLAQETESLVAVQENTETPRGQTNGQENPVTVDTSHPGGEDAEVQTDFTTLPLPVQPQTDPVCSGTKVSSPESPEKKDMSTLTEEWNLPDLEKSTSSDLSETSSCPDSTAGAAATTKAPAVYATDADPKPKSSNELTRDYIPKVGMTTYTIVPPKSLEKLRYFEVALTLESPPAASGDDGTQQLNEKVKLNQETETSKENKEVQSTVSEEDVPTGSASTQSAVNGSLPSPSSLVSSPSEESDKTLTNAASQTEEPTEAKENKKPPATKPKPGSFRLSFSKKTPGYYVTSAAEKSLNTSPVSSHAEVPGGAERTGFPSPPLSPSVRQQEEPSGTARVRLSPGGSVQNAATATVVRQSSLPCKDSRLGLSLEKLRSFASPRPYSPSTPSRFAQAVSSAVKRSQSVSNSQKSPSSPAVSPNSLQSKDSSTPGNDGSSDAERSKSFILQQEEVEAPTFPELVKLDEESCP